MLKTENLYKSFGERDILKDVNILIEEKSIVSITGVSGSGKSTLLGLLSGLLKPDSGKVYFNDQNIFKWGDFKRSRFRNHNMGFVFQFFSLFNEMTAYENILYPTILSPFHPKKVEEEIDYLVDLLKLNEIIFQHPATLSGGERQRVAIARAIINNPKFILADEPTGNLDEDTTEDIINLFIKLKEDKGITTILATHESKLVENSDINYHLENGSFIDRPIKKETLKKEKPVKRIKTVSSKKAVKKTVKAKTKKKAVKKPTKKKR